MIGGGSRRRLWGTLGGLVVGLGVGWRFGAPPWIVLSLVVVLVSIVRWRVARAISIFLLAVLGGLCMAGTRSTREAALADIAAFGHRCTIEGRVTEVSGLATFGRIDVARCDGFAPVDIAGTAAIVDDNLKAGDSFVAEGQLQALEDDPFDVARSRLGIDAVFYPEEMDVGGASGLAAPPAAFRESMTEVTSDLEARSGSLLLGLTIGETSGFDEDTLEAFRRSGLAHLLAVSGSNVAIVIGTVALCLRRSSAHARLAVCGSTLAFYVAVVGPDPSVVRAAVMGALGLLGIAWGSRPGTLAALGLALATALALRPALLFSVGLHLSAAATAGLVLWSRPLATLLGYKLPRWLGWPLGATLAAQIAVLPSLALTFGEVSITAPLANLAALPAVAAATLLGLAAASVGLLSETLGSALAVLASPLASWIVRCADLFGRPEWAQAQVSPWVGWMSLVLVGSCALRSARAVRGVL